MSQAPRFVNTHQFVYKNLMVSGTLFAALLLWDFNFEIEIHGRSFRVLINLVKFYHISPVFANYMPIYALK